MYTCMWKENRETLRPAYRGADRYSTQINSQQTYRLYTLHIHATRNRRDSNTQQCCLFWFFYSSFLLCCCFVFLHRVLFFILFLFNSYHDFVSRLDPKEIVDFSHSLLLLRIFLLLSVKVIVVFVVFARFTLADILLYYYYYYCQIDFSTCAHLSIIHTTSIHKVRFASHNIC